MIRRQPRATRTDTLFPYTTLFRSGVDVATEDGGATNRAAVCHRTFAGSDADVTPDDRTRSVRHAGLAERHNRGVDLGGRRIIKNNKVCSYAARVRGDEDSRSRDIIADITTVTNIRPSKSEKRAVGKAFVHTCRTRWSPYQ